MKETLYDKLKKLSEYDEYPFHMPGHKRGDVAGLGQAFQMDITEIEGFDNLHHPEGIIKEEEDFAAQLYGAKKTFFVINGSTAGVLSSICSCVEEGETILLGRNSHKSAYNALYLKNLRAEYLYPEMSEKKENICGPITPVAVEKKMKQSGAKVVFITSPTYEGVISDIAAIADVVHQNQGILIVDEAHGAHLGFHPYFPEGAVKSGADLVIQSMHKTLPALTQAALLHVCSDRVEEEKIAMWLSLLQTSSPSYLIMASMSHCLHSIEEKGESFFSPLEENLKRFYGNIKNLEHIEVIKPDQGKEIFHAETDPSKIVICVEDLVDERGNYFSGKQLAKKLLDTFHLQIEMVSESHVIAMTSSQDTKEGFRRLETALFQIDKTLKKGKVIKEKGKKYPEAVSVLTIKEALNGKKEKCCWKDCIGKVSAEYIYLYPPGSPILAPGEIITKEIWELIEKYRILKLNIEGAKDCALEEIYIAITS